LKKVLIIRFSSLGDVILSTSVIEPLYKKGFEIDFMTFKPFDTLFERDYRVKNILSFEKKQLKTVKDLKNIAHGLNKYDYVLDLHSNLRTKLISFFSNSKFYTYNKKGFQRRLLTVPFFKKFVNLRDFNVLKAYQDVLKKIGVFSDRLYTPKVILSKEEIDKFKKRFPRPYVVLGAGARYKNKMYPFFGEVSKLFLKEGYDVVLIGSKEDKSIDNSVYPEEVRDLRGELSIRESLSVISLSRLVVSNDSAVSHMARAVSVPVLMIYGATHPYFGFYPLKEEGEFIFKNLPCQPCDIHGKKSCKYKEPLCLTGIKPEFVLKVALDTINRFDIKSSS